MTSEGSLQRMKSNSSGSESVGHISALDTKQAMNSISTAESSHAHASDEIKASIKLPGSSSKLNIVTGKQSTSKQTEIKSKDGGKTSVDEAFFDEPLALVRGLIVYNHYITQWLIIL